MKKISVTALVALGAIALCAAPKADFNCDFAKCPAKNVVKCPKNGTFFTVRDGQYITVPANVLGDAKSYTVAIKGYAPGKGWSMLMAKESWNERTGWMLRRSGAKLYLSVNSRDVLNKSYNFDDAAKKQLAFAVVVTPAGVKLYVDGKEIGATKDVPKDNAVPFFFGARHGNDGKGRTDYSNGATFSAISIYRSALSAADIAELAK